MAKKVYCNKCGCRFTKQDLSDGVNIAGRFGYGSKYDGDIYDIDICANCLDDLVDSCEISPIDGEEEMADT